MNNDRKGNLAYTYTVPVTYKCNVRFWVMNYILLGWMDWNAT